MRNVLDLSILYDRLYAQCGLQGWWPLLNVGSTGYHPGDYTYPKTDAQRFEIGVGAILTQNTNWVNVEKALLALDHANALSADVINQLTHHQLATLIRSAGYYNQKAKKLKIFAAYFSALNGAPPTRDDLLSLWGIGPETADSILLYAYQKPTFIVDTYTRRILNALGWLDPKASYREVQLFFESRLEPDWRLFQEFHALLVEGTKLSLKFEVGLDSI